VAGSPYRIPGTIDDGGLSVPVNPTLRALDPVTEFTNLIPGDRDQRCQADALLIGGDYSPGFCVISKAGLPLKWDKRPGYGFSGASIVYTGTDLSEFDVEFTVITQTQMTEFKAFVKKYFPPNFNSASADAQNARAAAALSAQVQALTAQAQSVAQNPGATDAQKLQAEAALQNASDLRDQASSGTGKFLVRPPIPKALGVSHPILAEVGITKVVPSNIGQWSQTFGKWTKVVSFIQYRAPKPFLAKPGQATPAAAAIVPTAQDAAQLEMADKLKTAAALEDQLAGK
jgi:hypothetical protein